MRPTVSVDKFFDLLGLSQLSSEGLSDVIGRNASSSSVQQFQRSDLDYCKYADDASAIEFYRCFYGNTVPELDITWSELYCRVYNRDLDAKTLPELVHFCLAHETRRQVLDAGCGDGIALCFMAINCPDSRFCGIDRDQDALNLAERRIKRLGLQNVTLRKGDIFALDQELNGTFDCIIAKNILDDARERGSVYIDGRFMAQEKLMRLRRLIKTNARVWVSLSPYPHNTANFTSRLEADMVTAGFTVPPAQVIQYQVSDHAVEYLIWTLTPAAPHQTQESRLQHRPEYVSSYHFPVGHAIPVEDLVMAERCYINLNAPSTCPRCSTPGACVIYNGGPARTLVNHFKVFACVYSCGGCNNGYLYAEVID
ncbi:MAG: class I SAM-dependent methyltransferase [Patescibacteria group bacterium]